MVAGVPMTTMLTMAVVTAGKANCTHCYDPADWPRTTLERVQAISVVDALQQPAHLHQLRPDDQHLLPCVHCR